MKTVQYSILALIIVIIIMLCVIGDNDNQVHGCHINYNTEYVKVKPMKVEQPIVHVPSYERFYDENMLVDLDRSFFDESKYKTIMKHTNDGALL